MVTDDGKSDKEIRRIGRARSAYKNWLTILSSRDTSVNTRKRIVRCYVWATFLYDSETWSIRKSVAKKINAFEMWIYRRMLRIPWTAQNSNNDIFTMIGNKQLLLNIVKQEQAAYFGYMIRRDGLQRLFVDGKQNGKRGRGRPRTFWMDNIKEWTKLSYLDCVRKADDRESWKSIIVNLMGADAHNDDDDESTYI